MKVQKVDFEEARSVEWTDLTVRTLNYQSDC